MVLQSISHRRASAELLTLNIRRPILLSKLETCDTEVMSAQRKGVGIKRKEKCLCMEKAKANNSP